MILKEFIRQLEAEIPSAIQESYDNTGLQVGNINAEVSKALICMDITYEVLEEALTQSCDLIISHHPLLFHSIKRIDASRNPGKLIHFAVKNDIAIYSLHTSIDKYQFGVSYALAERLNLLEIRVLQPEKDLLKKLVTFCPTAQSASLRNALFNAGAGHIGNYDSCSFNIEGKGTFRALEGTNPYVGKPGELHTEDESRIEVIFPKWKKESLLKALLANHPYEEVAYDIYPLENNLENTGLGAIGNLKTSIEAKDFILKIQKEFNNNPLRFNKYSGKISRVAVCGGSGASLLEHAISAGADAFISADMKYHDFQAASERILMIDAGHYETEIQVLHLIKELISEKIPTFASLISETDTNFVRYSK